VVEELQLREVLVDLAGVGQVALQPVYQEQLIQEAVEEELTQVRQILLVPGVQVS
jgi:predicted nucleic acid-binding protein